MVLGLLVGLVWFDVMPSNMTRWAVILGFALVCLSVVDAFWLIPRRHASYRFALLGDRLVVAHGRLLTSELMIPIRQVLFVDLRQGPIQRHFGLVSVRLGTIADSHRIGPIAEQAAQHVRDHCRVGPHEDADA